MRTHADEYSGDVAQVFRELLRDAQFGRSAPPEQITRRSCNRGEMRAEHADPLADFVGGQVLQLAVHNLHLVPRPFEKSLGISVFERQVRLTAAEIDAVLETPPGINE